MTHAMLQVRDLSVRHGAVTAVSGVDLTVQGGETTVVLGVNGAGKTSLLRGLIGLAEARGQIMLDGRGIAHLATEKRIRAGLAWVPEGRRVFAGMTVAENLEVAGPADRAARNRRLDATLDRLPQLAPRLADRAWQLSGGQQQMLAIGRALMAEPRVYLLDEPSLGLAPAVVDSLAEILRSLTDNGAAVLIAEQNAGFARPLADKVLELRNGVLGPA